MDTNDFGEIRETIESIVEELKSDIVTADIQVSYDKMKQAIELYKKLGDLASGDIQNRVLDRLKEEFKPLAEVIMEFKEDQGRKTHNVYVIRLDSDVMNEPKYAKDNPQHKLPSPCVYVGMTWHDPDKRFSQHKSGEHSNRYAEQYGIELMQDEYEFLNPMTKKQASLMEPMLAKHLKNKGYAIWQR